MTGLEAVTAVAVYLNTNKTTIFGEKGGSIFKYEKENGYSGDYIAVNSLPFIHRDAVDTCTVNVNIHVPQLKSGQPNTSRLSHLVNEVVNLFPIDDDYGIFLNGAYFRFFADSRPTPDKDDTYYVNIELDCIICNRKVTN